MAPATSTTDYAFGDDGETGGRRRPAARRLMIGAAILAALCAAFLTGYGAHTGAADSTTHAAAPPTPPSTPRTPSTPGTPGAPGTPATTSPGPRRPDPSGAAVPPAPLTRNSAGVIVGYRHDLQGAVAAAGNYTAALYVQANRTRARELTVLTSIAATPADAARMAGDFASEDTALAVLLDVADLQSPGVIAYGHPLGYRPESADGTAATIDVYVAGGQGVADAPSGSAGAGQTFYEVDQVQLAWQPPSGETGGNGDWRMRNWSHLVQDNGPELASIAAEGYLPFPIGQTDPAGDGDGS